MAEHEARVWELLEKSSVSMLTTRFAQGMRARPMEPRPDPNGRARRVMGGPAISTVATFEFAKARVTGLKPNLGENRKVTVDMG